MRKLGIAAVVLALLPVATDSLAQVESRVGFPRRPESRVCILDEAGLVSPGERQEITSLIVDTLDQTAIPIVVVTIARLSDYGAERMGIEGYARALFDTWGIGHPVVRVGDREVPRNLGVLLLVSAGDRKARVELGADWGHRKDEQCRVIMQEHIVAAFKRGEFGVGIISGVRALSAMVREQELPSPPRPSWHYLAWAAFAGFSIFTAVSLIRRGSNGWAWAFWGLVFAILGFLLHRLTRARSSGGGFSGGSFGGGFSGGGGATGSW